eukprot:400303_1
MAFNSVSQMKCFVFLVQLNDITLHLREQFICSGCKKQSTYGVTGLCKACNKKLPSVHFEDSNGNKYHNECFTCLDCGTSLAEYNDRYMGNNDGGRLCRKCRQKRLYPGLKPKSPKANPKFFQ